MTLVTRARAAGMLILGFLLLGSLAPAVQAGTCQANFCLPKPDAQIRPGSNPSFVGDNTYNTDASGQKAFNTGALGQKLTFFIKIQNDSGTLTDSFKVKRSSGYTSGYRVRYYDAANNDITGSVTKGTFTTPSVVAGSDYVMRATVKVRSQATLCSFTSRRITVTSVTNAAWTDAVRFTAALATPGLNCPPVAVNDKASITENADSVSGNLFVNDIDPDGDPLTFEPFDAELVLVVPPSYLAGYVCQFGTGACTWFLDNSGVVDALNDGETLTQVIQYRINDFNAGVSNTATLTITIHGVTDPD